MSKYPTLQIQRENPWSSARLHYNAHNNNSIGMAKAIL